MNMCGICGYYGSEVNHLPLPMPRIKHRGPNDHGIAVDVCFKFGHTRLSIMDVDNGKQPMFNEDRSLCLVFNGEIYNYRQIKADLKREHQFKTDSDTEIILHLYEEEGVEGLRKLDGMFALALATPEGLVLARDPVGIKPLYFQKSENWTYFASEIKAFTNHADVDEFPAGTFFSTNQGYQTFFEIPVQFDPDLSWDECLAGLRTRLKKAVSKRLMADVPLGSFLSGGLDSSLITALIKEHQKELHTFSVSFKDGNDRQYAHQVSRFLGTTHHEIIVTAGELWKAIPEVIYYLESYDCSLVRSAVANYFLAKLAAEEVKVVLTGEGADELFAGYEYLNRFCDSNSLQKELWQITKDLHYTNLQRVDRMTMAHGLEARVPFLDKELIVWALQIPPQYKRNEAGISRWCLREAFRNDQLLPDEILEREKEKFSDGAGVAAALADMAENKVSDGGYQWELAQGTALQSKEEYYYFQIFVSYFGRERALHLVGRSKS
jgi:asparagine synthase (glutamine-hydrolyzing)